MSSEVANNGAATSPSGREAVVSRRERLGSCTRVRAVPFGPEATAMGGDGDGSSRGRETRTGACQCVRACS